MRWWKDKYNRAAAWDRAKAKLRRCIAYPIMCTHSLIGLLLCKIIGKWPVTTLPVPGWCIMGKWIQHTYPTKSKWIGTEVFYMPRPYCDQIDKKMKQAKTSGGKPKRRNE